MYLFFTNRQKNIRCKLFVQYKSVVPNLGNLPFETIFYVVYYITFTDHVCCIGCREISRAGLLFIFACNHRPNYNKIRLLEFPMIISLKSPFLILRVLCLLIFTCYSIRKEVSVIEQKSAGLDNGWTCMSLHCLRISHN